MAAPFYSLEMFPDFKSGHKLQWTIDPTFSDPVPFVFTLQVSEVPTFAELIAEKNVGDNFYATDDFGLKKNLGEDYFYRVKLETGDDTDPKIYYSENLRFGASASKRNQYLKAADIIRREFVRMKYTGFDAYVLKRKNFGEVDTANVDFVSGVPISDNVGGYGTGIVGGYYPPIAVRISRESTDADRQLNPQGYGVTESTDKIFRMAGFPSVTTRDIIVMGKDGDRFNVLKQKPMYMPGTDLLTVQTLQTKALPYTDTVYQIQVP